MSKPPTQQNIAHKKTLSQNKQKHNKRSNSAAITNKELGTLTEKNPLGTIDWYIILLN